VDLLELFILKNKLKTINKLKFFITLKEFKTYFGILKYLKYYVLYFVQIFEAL